VSVSKNRRLAVVAAGGTGGHLFPAQALSEALAARGWRIVLATDERGAAYAGSFSAEERIPLSAATYKPGDPVGLLKAALAIGRGVGQAMSAFRRLDPDIVVGFGGYPSVPSLLAALATGRRTMIHEQNAVMGRANRMLAPMVTEVACAFPTLKKASPKVAARAHVVGSPVRPEIRAIAGRPYAPPAGEIRILITGGSQGARLLSETTPRAIARLPEALRARLSVQQQTRPESADVARAIYQEAMVKAEIAPFFRDMASRLAETHLMIGRSGSSTVCEIAAVGRPSILIPLKVALDDDQGENARLLVEVGAAEMLREDAFTVESLAGLIETLVGDPARLEKMANAAKSVARIDAADRLADLVEATARD
jgi:UDP-N-acetylglucosamine--N-acetylmuramyl-(pentapeptide) pyrophosphoryl-undecaprenol N-acetylglucosamine transferase